MLVGQAMTQGRLLSALVTVAAVGSLVSCVPTSPDPSIVAPIALQRSGPQLSIAFCEDVAVGAISIQQRLRVDGRLTEWEPLFKAELHMSMSRLDVLALPNDSIADPELDRLQELSDQPGTQLYVGVVDDSGGGIGGQLEIPTDGWDDQRWLPSYGESTDAPCVFWDQWAGGGTAEG